MSIPMGQNNIYYPFERTTFQSLAPIMQHDNPGGAIETPASGQAIIVEPVGDGRTPQSYTGPRNIASYMVLMSDAIWGDNVFDRNSAGMPEPSTRNDMQPNVYPDEEEQSQYYWG